MSETTSEEPCLLELVITNTLMCTGAVTATVAGLWCVAQVIIFAVNTLLGAL